MTQRFLITGLPRSRTAWLSVVCSMMPGAYCAHEPVSAMRHWTDMLGFLGREDWPYIGIADCSLAFHLDAFMALRPRILIVERDIYEVEASLGRIGILAARFCERAIEKLHAFPDSAAVLRVPFYALKSDAVVRSCLWHLMPGIRIDMAKIAQAQDMRIEADLARVMAKVEAQKHNLDNLLGEDVAQWIRGPA
jgi:hypothetical protein